MSELPMVRNFRRGITLIEVVVSLMILSGAVTWIIQLLAANLRTISLSDDYTPLTIFAETKMRDILNEQALNEKKWSETSDDGYRTDISVCETLQERTDGLGLRLLEVSVTVRRDTEAKKKALTLRTIKAVRRPQS